MIVAMLAAAAALARAPAANTCRVLDIAIDTDVEFVDRRFGGDAFEAKRYLVNLVTKASAITAASLDLRVRISSLRLREGSTRLDPWNATTGDAQLEQFQRWWSSQERANPCDLAILVSGRDLGCDAFPSSVCTDRHCALLSNLTGLVPNHPQPHDNRNTDLVLLLRTIGIACGATATTECDGDGCASASTDAGRGSIMSSCERCPGGFANHSLRFADESVTAIWTFLDHVTCGVGAADSGVVPAADLVYVVAGTTTLIPILANDGATNCGPVTLDAVDAQTVGGLPLSVVPDENGVPSLLLSLPLGSLGSDTASYRIRGDVETGGAEPTGEGSIEIVFRRADFNGDGRTDRDDLSLMLEDWGSSTLERDLDGDGTVGSTDLALLLATWTSQR